MKKSLLLVLALGAALFLLKPVSRLSPSPTAALAESAGPSPDLDRAPRLVSQASASSGGKLSGHAYTTAPTGHFLQPVSTETNELMSTTRFQDYYLEPVTGQRIEVVGSMTLVHQSERGSFVSNKLAHWDHALGRPMAQSDARALAVAETGQQPLRLELKVLPNQRRGDARLVYWVDFEDRLLALDAASGAPVLSFSKHRAAAAVPKITVYSAQGLGVRTRRYGEGDDIDKLPRKLRDACQLVSTKKDSLGVPLLINPELCTLTAQDSAPLSGADDDSIRALKNSEIVARYYAEKHGRSSYDDRGSTLVSVVHVGDSYDNAYWDEEHGFMAYGDGDGEKSASYTLALDIVGHEMTHGVTAATAKLLGTGESGALNEAYSDFFGVMISNTGDAEPDWTIGKEIVHGEGQKEAGMRSLAEPGKFTTSVFKDAKTEEAADVPFPSRASEKLASGQECADKNDQCEVHGNSTIPGHASYLIAKALEIKDGSPKDRYDRAAKLYYTVLTQWLTSTDGFAQAAKDTIEACKLMYDAGDCAKVRQAFVETEMLVE